MRESEDNTPVFVCEVDPLPEFIGRFFVKIEHNSVFQNNVIDTSTEEETANYSVIESTPLYDRIQAANQQARSGSGLFVDFREEVLYRTNHRHKQPTMTRPEGQGIQVGTNRVDLS